MVTPMPDGIETIRQIAGRISKIAGHDVIAQAQEDSEHCQSCALWIRVSRLVEELAFRAVEKQQAPLKARRIGPRR